MLLTAVGKMEWKPETKAKHYWLYGYSNNTSTHKPAVILLCSQEYHILFICIHNSANLCYLECVGGVFFPIIDCTFLLSLDFPCSRVKQALWINADCTFSAHCHSPPLQARQVWTKLSTKGDIFTLGHKEANDASFTPVTGCTVIEG